MEWWDSWDFRRTKEKCSRKAHKQVLCCTLIRAGHVVTARSNCSLVLSTWSCWCLSKVVWGGGKLHRKPVVPDKPRCLRRNAFPWTASLETWVLCWLLKNSEKQSFIAQLEEYGDLLATGLPFKRDEVDRQLSELLSQGRIKPSNSPWSSPILLAKKHDGSYRLCIDYRRLNAVTVKDAKPLPRSNDILESLGGAQWFSCLDFPSQRGIAQKPHLSHIGGQFQWTCFPFGVTNGPGTFTRLMNLALQGLTWKECLIYLDDIIIMSSTFNDHLSRLCSVFDRLQNAGLRLKPPKCIFLQWKVSFLGHVVSEKGIQTDPEKTASVCDWPTPTSELELKGFLGLLTYYRRFIPGFAATAEPLNCLTRKNVEFKWGDAQEKAFRGLKDCLTNPPVLAYPDFSIATGQFILDTDASSGSGIGAVLSQKQADGTERVIAYGSAALHRHERNYCATGLEILVLVDFIDHFHYYLLGRKFLVWTDHHALMMSFKQPEGQVACGWRDSRNMISLLHTVLERVMRMQTKDENMEVAHRVVIPHMWPQQFWNQTKRRRGHPRPQKANFLELQSKLLRPNTVTLTLAQWWWELKKANLNHRMRSFPLWVRSLGNMHSTRTTRVEG